MMLVPELTMSHRKHVLTAFSSLLSIAVLNGCATSVPPVDTPLSQSQTATPVALEQAAKQTSIAYEKDRQAILAMAGDYSVRFDFRETVSFEETYELKPPKLSGGHEVVRVIEDSGEFISLQHTLVVGGEDHKMAIKHWRQDWTYEPEGVLTFVGGNAWTVRKVSDAGSEGAWSQVVYQVDDAPRYGALGKWTHDNGVSEWTPPAEWRPLPRRDATTRDDYDAIHAVNRHAITATGWVHEQDNSKLILREGEPRTLVREVGINTYTQIESNDAYIADDYFEATQVYWAAVRKEWTRLENDVGTFGLTIQGEPEALYMPLLTFADEIIAGDKTNDAAIAEAKATIAKFTTNDIGTLQERVGLAN